MNTDWHTLHMLMAEYGDIGDWLLLFALEIAKLFFMLSCVELEKFYDLRAQSCDTSVFQNFLNKAFITI